MKLWYPLGDISDEFQSAEAAVNYIASNGLVREIGRDERGFGIMRAQLEATYIIRLASSFERILSAQIDADDDRLATLVDEGCRVIGEPMRAEALHAIRRERNGLVHPKGMRISTSLSFAAVLQTFKIFLNRLEAAQRRDR